MDVRGWVGNLGKYNEGELVGEWVTFPVDEEERQEIMDRIGIGKPVDPDDPLFGTYEETFFADYDCELPLFDVFGEYPQWETLNEIAEAVEDVEGTDAEVLLAIIGNMGTASPDEIRAGIRDYESGDWRFFPGCDDMSDVAQVIAWEDPAFESAPDFMQRHFDFASYGEELDSSGTFLPTESGYVEVYC